MKSQQPPGGMAVERRAGPGPGQGVPRLRPVYLCGVVLTGVVYTRNEKRGIESSSASIGNPLGLWNSLKMALAFQAVLVLLGFLRDRVGTAGVLASAAALGLTDVDGLTCAMTRLASVPEALALGARGIAVGRACGWRLESARPNCEADSLDNLPRASYPVPSYRMVRSPRPVRRSRTPRLLSAAGIDI